MTNYASDADLCELIQLRKKFLKMRHIFREKMKESHTLFDDEQNAMKLARRLQEQNESVILSPCQKLLPQLMEIANYSTYYSMSMSRSEFLHICSTIFVHLLLMRLPFRASSQTDHLAEFAMQMVLWRHWQRRGRK